MKQAVRQIADWLARPLRVEFDYQDGAGLHHGQCYVRALFGSKRRVVRQLQRCGYRNIDIC